MNSGVGSINAAEYQRRPNSITDLLNSPTRGSRENNNESGRVNKSVDLLLREEENDKQLLRKENFDLKLRVDYLEEKLLRLRGDVEEDDHELRERELIAQINYLRMEAMEKDERLAKQDLICMNANSVIRQLQTEREELHALLNSQINQTTKPIVDTNDTNMKQILERIKDLEETNRLLTIKTQELQDKNHRFQLNSEQKDRDSDRLQGLLLDMQANENDLTRQLQEKTRLLNELRTAQDLNSTNQQVKIVLEEAIEKQTIDMKELLLQMETLQMENRQMGSDSKLQFEILNSQLKESQGHLQEVENRKKELEIQNAVIKKELETFQSFKNDDKNMIRQLQSSFDEASRSLQSQAQQLAEYKSAFETEKSQKEKLARDLFMAEKDGEDIKRQFSILSSKLNAAERKLEMETHRASKSQEELVAMEKNAERVSAKAEETQKKLDQVSEEYTKVIASHDSLRTKHQSEVENFTKQLLLEQQKNDSLIQRLQDRDHRDAELQRASYLQRESTEVNRQAKAQVKRNYEREIQSIDTVWTGKFMEQNRKLDHLQSIVQSLTEKAARAKKRLTDANVEKETMNSQHQKVVAHLQAHLEAEKSVSEKRIQQKNETIQKLEGDLKESARLLQSLEQLKNKVQSDVQRDAKASEELQQQAISLTENNRLLILELEEKRSITDTLRKQLQSVYKENNSLLFAMDHLKHCVSERDEQLDYYIQKIQEYTLNIPPCPPSGSSAPTLNDDKGYDPVLQQVTETQRMILNTSTELDKELKEFKKRRNDYKKTAAQRDGGAGEDGLSWKLLENSLVKLEKLIVKTNELVDKSQLFYDHFRALKGQVYSASDIHGDGKQKHLLDMEKHCLSLLDRNARLSKFLNQITQDLSTFYRHLKRPSNQKDSQSVSIHADQPLRKSQLKTSQPLSSKMYGDTPSSPPRPTYNARFERNGLKTTDSPPNVVHPLHAAAPLEDRSNGSDHRLLASSGSNRLCGVFQSTLDSVKRLAEEMSHVDQRMRQYNSNAPGP